MPTIPVPPSRPHEQRQVAESFGTDADRYDRTRPRYADALVERVVAAAPGPEVLDVGCGTGISARQFQAAGCQVLGVDPDERMAALARGHGLEVEVATFEAWDPAGRTFDAVIAGQAWHWVDPAAGAAQAARVLRTGGLLAVFWNAFEVSPEVNEAITAAYRRVLPDSPMARAGMPGPEVYRRGCDLAADGIRATGAFEEPQQWRFDWEQPYTRDEWLDLFPTFGTNTQLPPGTLRELTTGIGAAIDAIGGRFTMRYATMATAATKS